MPAGVQNFLIEQGSSWEALLVYKVNGVPQDITGCTVYCQIKDIASGSIVATPTCTLTDATVGSIKLALTPSQTWAIPSYGRDYTQLTNYTYDALLQFLDGTAPRLLNGTISISPGVTKI